MPLAGVQGQIQAIMALAGRGTSGTVKGAGLALLSLLSCVSCTEPPLDPCPKQQPPSFLVTVTAVEGPLPTDTRIRLAYGGGEEEYNLNGAGNQPSVMFCRAEADGIGQGGAAGSAGAGGMGGNSNPDSSASAALICELWIEGAATIWVDGGEYDELEMELRGEANECGPETVEEHLELGEDATDSDEP